MTTMIRKPPTSTIKVPMTPRCQPFRAIHDSARCLYGLPVSNSMTPIQTYTKGIAAGMYPFGEQAIGKLGGV